MTDKKPDLWDVNGANEDDLRWSDPEEAICEYLLEGHVTQEGSGNERLDAGAPETVTLTGWVRETVDTDCLATIVLDYLIESLDDDYAGEDRTEPTADMKAAAATFVESVVSQYKVWLCHKVSTETVNVREWCAENEPGWLR